MIQPLFRKLYLYAVLSVFIAMVLTVSVMNLLFRHNERHMHRVFLEDQVHFVQFVLQQSSQSQPELLQLQVEEIGSYLDWRISYWKKNQMLFSKGIPQPPLSVSQLNELEKKRDLLILDQQKPIRVASLLDPNRPELGYLQYTPAFTENPPPGPPPQKLFPEAPHKGGPPPRGAMMPPPGRRGPPPNRPMGDPRLIYTLIILLSLGVLLIPLVLYITRPFKELSASIAKVTEGDFTRPINVGKQKEFQEIANGFNHMMSRIQEMLQEKQRLIADVSHELRSPLARMRVSLELLAKEGKGKPKYIERSIFELEELDRLINDLLDISALELNAENYPLERLELGHLLRESLEMHQYILAEKELEVITDYTTETILINGRRDLLHRALNNLFSNLLKYAPPGSRVDISVYCNAEKAGIRFRDRGPGLPQEELEEILKPFYRPDSSRTRKTGGNGLGLAIVDKIMRLHKGFVRFELPSDEAGGLIACLEWPLQRNPRTDRLETPLSEA
ncbi:hypothetical protein COW36_05795 [bacterium (Candidatus Blackallbacteria) CG17_big_fil_post_rev_8_21_14_2_50_48_46]|uniref:histidine kinase n=1 Tax=bacterium (Candidatus Blackallbacteria) CG17_big_fil_post_rev_8_21_14_2_50_48_46 TaxID=2014261 RepID=A0A2M7G871_9BACT|nr:MAG: hypothetical protein COW64_21390 [bacterium (Candidatus Blackallbacteria) CG18_big_fil_WC_8_21_14_2_50_49_26]PIW18280.1 MAG: hypothetical protein COW36_05795 [bacterium (Candidatus Blackallbacteria) CG17_big_fil_post_rev_8_21_14_2_50_48_46]PIW49504.1 MAG: hypothetical protein COW20_05610 [bacterium (Candidatus Blackallbacteria) CG13_big_fil_rev_8_21_14_2_50_49_14]